MNYTFGTKYPFISKEKTCFVFYIIPRISFEYDRTERDRKLYRNYFLNITIDWLLWGVVFMFCFDKKIKRRK